ncbi:MAG TPA: MFS transporter [Dissulfurispiraceae bacterium]|nr:MFS transporter [Dissulfurispiraceae bacterium]
MKEPSEIQLQIAVFALVSASFANIYITQPVLPVLRQEFHADTIVVSLSVSAVILGMALSNLPLGALADRLPIRPIILSGGACVALAGLLCAATENIWLLIAARFVQGIFIPTMTTCLAAYLAKTLPTSRLSIIMGSYVAATVLGGLCGRLLGGWIHPPLHWRYAFVSASALILIAIFAALRILPRQTAGIGEAIDSPGYGELLRRRDLWPFYFCAAGSFAVFSSIFNYLPFRVTAEPFSLSTEITTVLYLVYIVGIFMGPTAGKISNYFGSGITLIAGSLLLGASLAVIAMPSLPAIVVGLIGTCAGFFTIHATAVGSLNRRISGGQGRANALYVLFYYLGGWAGITLSGFAYAHGGWTSVISTCFAMLVVPLYAGIKDFQATRNARHISRIS